MHIKGKNLGQTLDWTYIEWHDEAMGKRMDAQTQTTHELVDKQTQTCNPYLMRIELGRASSRLSFGSLGEMDGMRTPLFQFDRQAPARISTSPTLRRMRSTRLPSQDSGKLSSAREELGTTDFPSPRSPLSHVYCQTPVIATDRESNGDSHWDAERPAILGAENGSEIDLSSVSENVDSDDTADDSDEVKYTKFELKSIIFCILRMSECIFSI